MRRRVIETHGVTVAVACGDGQAGGSLLELTSEGRLRFTSRPGGR